MNIGSSPGHRKRDPRPGLRVPPALVIQLTLAFHLYLFPTAGGSETTQMPIPEVRLVNGRSRCQGRVEIFYNHTWGTVCDDDWDIVDAHVVCRQLGCGHAIATPATLFFGQGRGPILLDNVDCQGREPALSACGSLGWGTHNCYHYEDVAVTCNELFPTLARGSTSKTTATSFHNGKRDGSVRLVSGANACQGRVEIFYQGHWGTVCDDDWGMSDVGVVCRQLGCGHATDYRTNAYFGHGTGHILLDNVNCDGSEPRLSSCYSLGWGVHNCGHHEDAGAICSGLGMTTITAATPSGAHSYEESFTNTATVTGGKDLDSPETEMTVTSARLLRGKRSGGIRLASGNGSCQGRVEVQFRGAWGTVCDDDWGFPDAQVACRQVGCGPAVAPTVLGYFGYGAGPILLDNVACAGTEAHLADCFHLGWGQHNCGHHEDAGVICRGAGESGNFFSDDTFMTTTSTTTRPKDGFLRLVNGSHRCEGRVEMFYLSQWGTVCDDAWDLADVKVVCQQLGCGGALAASGEARYGQGAGYIFLDNLKCQGNEPSLLRCSHIRWNVHNCDHSEDAGALCSLL